MTAPKTKKTKSLLVTPIEVTANGETLRIRPFAFSQLPEVTARLLPLFSSLESEGETINLDRLIVNGGENLFQVLAMAIEKPREWIDELRGEQGYEEAKSLIKAVYEANKGLFTKKLMPDLQALMARMEAKVKAQTAAAEAAEKAEA